MQGHADTVTGTELSPDGSYLLTTAMDNTGTSLLYTVLQKKTLAKLFLSLLHQISISFDNLWHICGKEAKCMWGAHKQKWYYILHYCIIYYGNYKKHKMQSNKQTVDMAIAHLLGYQLSSVDWLNPFDECPLVNLSKNMSVHLHLRSDQSRRTGDSVQFSWVCFVHALTKHKKDEHWKPTNV